MKRLKKSTVAGILTLALAVLCAACSQPGGLTTGGGNDDPNSPGSPSDPDDPGISRVLNGIAIASKPDILIYALDQPFDSAGLVVQAFYDDGSTRNLTPAEYSVTTPNTQSDGAKLVTVNALGYSTQFAIYVNNNHAVLQNIYLVSEPSKKAYGFGEEFSTAGMTVKAAYYDSTQNPQNYEETISVYNVGGFDSSRRGAQSVQVAANGKTAAVSGITVSLTADTVLTVTGCKRVYIKGQAYDLAQTMLNAKRTVNGRTFSANITNSNGGLSLSNVSGFTPTPGLHTVTITLDAASVSHTATGVDIEPHVYFDYGYMRTAADPAGKGSFNTGEAHYSAVLNRPLVLAPVRMLIGYNADNTPGLVSYSWSVSGPAAYTQGNTSSECFTFTPTGTGTWDVTVNVTGRNFITGASDTKSATTKVVCGGTGASGSFPNPLKNFAPGQFTKSGTGYGWSLGAQGGYEVWRLGTNGASFRITGNPFLGSSEPGIVWVSYDDNGNNIPDDTWYELKGSEESRAAKRYAVTYRNSPGGDVLNEYGQLIKDIYWADSKGRTGVMGGGWPADWGVPDNPGEQVTYTGTRLGEGYTLPLVFTGYVDAWGGSASNTTVLFSKSNAIQQDGSAITTLQGVSFVKVQTGVFNYGGATGEVSTEIHSADGLGAQTTFPLP